MRVDPIYPPPNFPPSAFFLSTNSLQLPDLVSVAFARTLSFSLARICAHLLAAHPPPPVSLLSPETCWYAAQDSTFFLPRDFSPRRNGSDHDLVRDRFLNPSLQLRSNELHAPKTFLTHFASPFCELPSVFLQTRLFSRWTPPGFSTASE